MKALYKTKILESRHIKKYVFHSLGKKCNEEISKICDFIFL